MKPYLLLALCLAATPVFAQTVEQDGANDPYSLKTERAERIFLKYHMAMRADESCRKQQIAGNDLLAMDRITAARMAYNIPDVGVGAARLLTLRRQANDRMDDIIDREGCNGQSVTKALQVYDEKLAPLATSQTAAQAQAAQDTAAAPAANADASPLQAGDTLRPLITTQPVAEAPVEIAPPESLAPAPR